MLCPSCGTENPAEARFCMSCATPMGAPSAPRETRKTVTVLFSDVAGSTAMGEGLDPESLRSVMSRYFAEMRAVLERHGGTVEKFIGDAVMAVFGIPVLHEDDALRAVRAAAEMGEALAALNAEIERDRGVRIQIRTGVNTGEVMAGDPAAGETLVTGDPVNVAARLEQAAAPGEVLIGEATHRLVRDAVEVEPVEPVPAKGKSHPVPAFRLLAVRADRAGIDRRLDSPMIGRSRELQLLRLAMERAAEERTCHLATVLGAAGVGKSRLVEEFLREASARVLRGRCLPYGEGITFWPVAEVLREAAGIADDDPPLVAVAKLERLGSAVEDGASAAIRAAQAIGLTEDSALPEETFRSIRRMLEAVAAEGPVVVVFDDLHWAEQTFLDLVEHVADWTRDAPILLLCMAREELLDGRPGWGGGKLNATTIHLQPLSEEECDRLVENLLGSVELAGSVRERILTAAEGNPLYVEEMLSMLIDDGLLRRDDGRWVPAGDLSKVAVPPSVSSLIAARLDRLAHEERAVIERAAVVGRVFYRGAVTILTPEPVRPAVPASLGSLVRRELIRPHHGELGGEESYRFRHILTRDAAYEGMPKELRAELHERFAGWLEAAVGDRALEYEEIVAHHLDQAWRYRTDLGPPDERARSLAHRAGRMLVSAGLRALSRGDYGGGTKLLERAIVLLPADDPERVAALPDLAHALAEAGRLDRAGEVLEEALVAAALAGDRAIDIRARAVRLNLLAASDEEAGFVDGRAEAERLLEEAERVGDPQALCVALRVVAIWRFWTGHAALALEAAERGVALATEAGLPREVAETTFAMYGPLVWGPTPVPEMIAWGERATAMGGLLEGFGAGVLAMAHAMEGRVDETWDAVRREQDTLRDYGAALLLATGHLVGSIAQVLGASAEAEAHLREGAAALERMGERGFLSTTAAYLAEIRYRLGRYDEAEEAARLSRETSAPNDVGSEAQWRYVSAMLEARRGRFDEAVRLAAEAVAICEETDHIVMTADAYAAQAEVLDLRGDASGAARAVRSALEMYERKGNRTSASRIREAFAHLRP